MAVGQSTTNNANYLNRATGLPTFNTSTVCGYFYYVGGSGGYSTICALNNASSGYVWLGLDNATANVVVWSDTGAFSSTIQTLTSGNWYFWALEVNGATVTGYCVPLGTAVSSGQTTTVGTGLTTISVFLGQDPSSVDTIAGYHAYVRAWSSVLSVAELNAERISSTAVKAGSTFDASLLNTSTLGGFSIAGSLSSMAQPVNGPVRINTSGSLIGVGAAANIGVTLPISASSWVLLFVHNHGGAVQTVSSVKVDGAPAQYLTGTPDNVITTWGVGVYKFWQAAASASAVCAVTWSTTTDCALHVVTVTGSTSGSGIGAYFARVLTSGSIASASLTSTQNGSLLLAGTTIAPGNIPRAPVASNTDVFPNEAAWGIDLDQNGVVRYDGNPTAGGYWLGFNNGHDLTAVNGGVVAVEITPAQAAANPQPWDYVRGLRLDSGTVGGRMGNVALWFTYDGAKHGPQPLNPPIGYDSAFNTGTIYSGTFGTTEVSKAFNGFRSNTQPVVIIVGVTRDGAPSVQVTNSISDTVNGTAWTLGTSSIAAGNAGTPPANGGLSTEIYGKYFATGFTGSISVTASEVTNTSDGLFTAMCLTGTNIGAIFGGKAINDNHTTGNEAAQVVISAQNTGSLILAMGNDWRQSGPVTVSGGQTKLAEFDDTGNMTSWLQRLNGYTTGTGNITMGITAPTTQFYSIAAVEVLAK